MELEAGPVAGWVPPAVVALGTNAPFIPTIVRVYVPATAEGNVIVKGVSPPGTGGV